MFALPESTPGPRAGGLISKMASSTLWKACIGRSIDWWNEVSILLLHIAEENTVEFVTKYGQEENEEGLSDVSLKAVFTGRCLA